MTRLLRRSGALLPVLGLVLVAGACDSIFGPRDSSLLREQLARSEALWADKGVTHYGMTVVSGPAFGVTPRAVRLEVANGVIQSAVYHDDETPVEPAVRAAQQTVTQLFALIRDALDRRVPGIVVRYDDDFGFPELIQIDYDPTRLDDDIFVSVSEFTPAA
jgi:hypothetical protein